LNSPAGLETPGSFCLYLSIQMFDKGKPVEKQGRKAMDLQLRFWAQPG
jgi:hypothetical protein